MPPLPGGLLGGARTDGLFPLLTNDPDLTAAAILDAYKTRQPLVEKRHDLLKNVAAATPICLKSISRLEAGRDGATRDRGVTATGGGETSRP